MDTAEIVSFASNRQAALLVVVVSLGILLACAWGIPQTPVKLDLRAALAMARDATQAPAQQSDGAETGREVTLRFRRRPANGEAYGVAVRLRIDPQLEG